MSWKTAFPNDCDDPSATRNSNTAIQTGSTYYYIIIIIIIIIIIYRNAWHINIIHFPLRHRLTSTSTDNRKMQYDRKTTKTRKPCYRKDDRAMRPIYTPCPEKKRPRYFWHNFDKFRHGYATVCRLSVCLWRSGTVITFRLEYFENYFTAD